MHSLKITQIPVGPQSKATPACLSHSLAKRSISNKSRISPQKHLSLAKMLHLSTRPSLVYMGCNFAGVAQKLKQFYQFLKQPSTQDVNHYASDKKKKHLEFILLHAPHQVHEDSHLKWCQTDITKNSPTSRFRCKLAQIINYSFNYPMMIDWPLMALSDVGHSLCSSVSSYANPLWDISGNVGLTILPKKWNYSTMNQYLQLISSLQFFWTIQSWCHI